MSQRIKSNLVIPRGFEPLILWLKTRCPRPLDDGTKHIYYNNKLKFLPQKEFMIDVLINILKQKNLLK